MLGKRFRDVFVGDKSQDLEQLMRNEYRREYKYLREMGAPITRKLVNDFLYVKSL